MFSIILFHSLFLLLANALHCKSDSVVLILWFSGISKVHFIYKSPSFEKQCWCVGDRNKGGRHLENPQKLLLTQSGDIETDRLLKWTAGSLFSGEDLKLKFSPRHSETKLVGWSWSSSEVKRQGAHFPEFKEDFTSAHAQEVAPWGSKREGVHNKCGHAPIGEMGYIYRKDIHAHWGGS